VLGRKVIYRHPGDWGGYQSDMQRDAYDLVFDGPHFVSWRIERFRHNALVKLPGDFLYVGFVRKDNTRIKNIEQLAGQKVCVHAPPNLGTLMLLNAFDNPTRQPVIIITKGYDKIYQGLMEDSCVGAMLPVKHLAKHDKNGEKTRVIYSHKPYPQQALTAGVRINAEDRAKLVTALLAPEAESALSAFREAYALGGWFVPATNEEYAGVSAFLKPVQGFYKTN
jgi:ABC-type phosphate/phosphonate transport system substrate-binding protein